LRWPEVGCRRDPETVAGVSCGGGTPASGGRRGRAGKVRWEPWEVRALPIWGERERRRQSRGGQKLVGAREGRRYWAREQDPQLFIGKWEERRKVRASSASTLSCYGGRPRDHGGRQRCRRAALAIPQAAWHSGKEPAEEARAVEERWGDTWAREEQEVDGGG
jgi:hypothetical protein